MSYREIPFFITSFNRLTYLKELLSWLEKANFQNIIVLDNDSKYPPLLEFLEKTKHRVVRLQQNYGHLALWKCGLFEKEITSDYFCLSDCDVVPDTQCPTDIVKKAIYYLEKYKILTKVGPSLRIDNIPDSNQQKKDILDVESAYYEHFYKERTLYRAPIDTTFAVYRPNISPLKRDLTRYKLPQCEAWWLSARMAAPYEALHLPWYEDSRSDNAEQEFYRAQIRLESSAYTVPDPNELFAEFNRLKIRVKQLEAENFLLSQQPMAIVFHMLRNVWRRFIY